MPGLTGDLDSAVRVVVTPTQSSYFAGEPFSVTITFTNTRSADSGPSKPYSHKRGAHSITSVPLARPPTSPGNPRTIVTPLPPPSRSKDNVATRKGLIGKSRTEELPGLIEHRRKKLLAKSLSVSITPHILGEGALTQSASFAQRSFTESRVAHIPSHLARSEALPLGPNHPHARKQSIYDGHHPEFTTSPIPYSPTSSASTFSLALDPIAESAISPYPSSPAIASPTIENTTASTFSSIDLPQRHSVYGYLPPRAGHRPSPIGLGQPSNGFKSSRTATFSQSNAELILYSYAQLTGTLSLTPVSGTTASPEQAQTLNSVRAALLKRSVIGGGSMDITSSLHPQQLQQPFKPPHRRGHSRTASFSSGLLSLIAPSSLVASSSTPPHSPTTWAPSHRSRASSAYIPPPPPTNGRLSVGDRVGLGLAPPSPPPVADEDVDPDAPLPTFEVQPTMLAVDLSLLPGESRSYTYTIPLPDNLPPTFKGRALRFSYELVVGTCRAGPGGSGGGGSGANSVSRVMKVPIRVYNNVVVGRLPTPYDLLWPVSKRIGPPPSAGKVVEETGGRAMKTLLKFTPSSTTMFGDTLDDLQDYAHRLLESFPDPGASGVRIKLPAEGVSPVLDVSSGSRGQEHAWEELERERQQEEARRREREREREEEGGLTGCREAVEILTRNPKKASYDVNKDGVQVAVLTFTKSAYRLGETVLGVVELNDRSGRSRVLQLSAILEAHESLPSSISPPAGSRHLRRTHAEHHSSFSLSTLRTTFCLDIPSDASPAFHVRVGSNQPGAPPTTSGGLEWKVRLCLLVAVAAESSHQGTEGVRMKNMIRDGPRGVWGSSWRAPSRIAPLEKPMVVKEPVQTPNPNTSWTSYFAATLFGPSAKAFHDGDEEEGEDEEGAGGYDGVKADRAGGVGVGVNFAGGEEGWKEVRLETVECEVTIKVWPGNTAFKAADVVFDV